MSVCVALPSVEELSIKRRNVPLKEGAVSLYCRKKVCLPGSNDAPAAGVGCLALSVAHLSHADGLMELF